MLQNDIIKPSASSWASLVVLVRKAYQILQLCTDYRNINKATIKDSCLLPHIQNSLDTLYGNTLVMTFDLLKVYHQIKVEENSRKKTAFTTTVGLFQCIHLPFRLYDASASQENSGVVMPITISPQPCHISCSALVDTDSPVTLLSELPYTILLESHYHLFRANRDALSTLGTVQFDIVAHCKVWPTPAILYHH